MRYDSRGRMNAAALWIFSVIVAGIPAAAIAVSMMNDPKGFRDIAWGAPLSPRTDVAVARAGPYVTEYELKGVAPSFGGVPVQSIRLSSVDDQFARVTIRYQGEESHKLILTYLEREFGSIERIPGQMMRGLNQQYNWRGNDSEINLTYQASTERGFVFLDSRTLAPRFNDHITDSAE